MTPRPDPRRGSGYMRSLALNELNESDRRAIEEERQRQEYHPRSDRRRGEP